jgi:hypothetical protein
MMTSLITRAQHMKKKPRKLQGRPPIENRQLVKVAINIKLPRWLLDWMAEQPTNRARLIEESL